MSKTPYSFTEKITKREQWRECALKMARQQMTADEVEPFKDVLAACNECDPSCISHTFSRIPHYIDDPDPDELTHLIVCYRMTFEGRTKEIFRIKVPIPDSVKRMAVSVGNIHVGPAVEDVTTQTKKKKSQKNKKPLR